MAVLVPLVPPTADTTALENSVSAIVSVVVLLLATAYLTHRYSPFVILGAVVLQPLSVPPLSVEVLKV